MCENAQWGYKHCNHPTICCPTPNALKMYFSEYMGKFIEVIGEDNGVNLRAEFTKARQTDENISSTLLTLILLTAELYNPICFPLPLFPVSLLRNHFLPVVLAGLFCLAETRAHRNTFSQGVIHEVKDC